MMIGEAEAIEAALRFATDRQGGLGDLEVKAERKAIEGAEVWAVKVRERNAGADAWMDIDWKPVSYFVDGSSGLVIGFATERSTTMLRQTAALNLSRSDPQT
jgi:hypothetical protein